MHLLLVQVLLLVQPLTATVTCHGCAEDDDIYRDELPRWILPNMQKTVTEPFSSTADEPKRSQRSRKPTLMDIALQVAAREGLDAMTELYQKIEPEIIRNGQILEDNHPAALLSKFSAPVVDTERSEMAAYATLSATKVFRKNYKLIDELARQAHGQKISLRRTALEGLCPPRDPPTCMPASERYRTHDGTCNNKRRSRWGAAQMPFNRFLPPEYGDGVDTIRNSVEGGPLPSSRFVSLLVHGGKDGEAPLTLMIAQWGQLLDHDMTSTAQPRSINGSVPSCCGGNDFHPSCFPIKVPFDDPWLAPLKVRCLEFLRSAPAQRRDCVLSWREQTNQATSYIDASPIYSNNAKLSDNARVFRNGLLVFGRGNPDEDVCQRGAIATQCIRAGDGRSGEQPGLLALHHVWVGEHNRIAMELSEMNLHWSDEKIYQETRRIIGAIFQHITYREFLPLILGREVCKLFDLDLLNSGYYEGYDHKVNPSVANSFSAAAFRFGHSLVQNSYLRCDRHHNIISNNISLHEEFQRGDIGSAGSLHRLLRGMATQRALKRDEFITPELTNHLFQTPGFPFGLDLAAINIQRGRDHGIAPYTAWRIPCGLTPVNNWDDFAHVVGPESAKRIGHAYRNVHDIDLFVGGIAERPVVGGLVGPTFACIIAQQFSNSRKGDRFWYENGGFENSFTPAQLHSLRRVSLSQILCRAVGGGTLQPHIFLPPDIPGNERLLCGIGPLAQIDLSPWLEQDLFAALPSKPTFVTQMPDGVFEIVPTGLFNSVQVVKEDKAGFSNRINPVKSTTTPLPHISQINPIPNASTGLQRPKNITKVSDKLDIKRKKVPTPRPSQKPINGVNNKLDKDTRVTQKVKGVNRRRLSVTTRRTVIINNLPIELRAATPEASIQTKTDAKTPKRNSTRSTSKKRTKITSNSTETDRPRSRLDDNEAEVDSIPTNNRDDFLTITPGYSDMDINNTTVEQSVYDTLFKPTEPTITLTTAHTAPIIIEQPTRFTQLKQLTLNKTDSQNFKSFYNISDNTDKDPMTHSPSSEHKRFHRRISLSEGITQNRQSRVFLNTSQERPLYVRKSITDETSATKASAKSILQKTKDFLFKNDSLFHNFHKKIHTTNQNDSTFHNFHKKIHTTNQPITTNVALTDAEMRDYATRFGYTRPQKVVVDGSLSDQYEIEINIRQTNKIPVSRPVTQYADYTTVHQPFGFDQYIPNYLDSSSTTPSNGYYQQPPKVQTVFPQRTKPPTVIYLNEHEDYSTMGYPGLLQNFINLATNTFSNQKPILPPKQKPAFEVSLSNNHINSPHSSNFAANPNFPQPQSGINYPVPGGIHASSSATSSVNFGSIAGLANTNGADSTFSINIRPRPELTQSGTLPSKLPGGSYQWLPQGPPYSQTYTPEYSNFPGSTPSTNPNYGYTVRKGVNSPFSTSNKSPQYSPLYSRTQDEKKAQNTDAYKLNPKLDIEDLDYFSRTLVPIVDDMSTEENSKDKDEYDYGDDDEAIDKKFDRDGYLRPEHMVAALFNAKKNRLTNDSFDKTLLNDNFVVPVLTTPKHVFTKNDAQMMMKVGTLNMSVTQNFTDFLSAEAKHGNNKILADCEKDSTKSLTNTSTTTTDTELVKNNNSEFSVAFAPIEVLTKPERPDNWVNVETSQNRTEFPQQPEIRMHSLHSDEIPKPIKNFLNVWLAEIKKNNTAEAEVQLEDSISVESNSLRKFRLL